MPAYIRYNPDQEQEETQVPNPNKPNDVRFMVKMGVILVIVLAVVIASFVMFDVETVGGHEVAVMETWNDGVKTEPYTPKTYFLFINEKLYKYDTSTQVFVMNDLSSVDESQKKGHTKDITKGREKDAYLVQSAEGQDMHISLNVQWRIDPKKVVDIHKTVRHDVEEKLIRPVVMRIIKDQATKRTAIEAYSGQGLVNLQIDIQKNLMEKAGELSDRGIIIENFVIEGIRLDPKYISEITEKQVAIQRKLKADEQTKAAQAEALRAEAEAQSDLKKQVVAAERDKQVGILSAEKSARQAVLAAEADKQKVVLQAEAEKEKLVLTATGSKDAELLRAQGILAVGKASAEAQKLQYTAYETPGAKLFVTTKVAESVATAHQNVKGYLPQNMNIYTLGSNFVDAVTKVTGALDEQPRK